MSFFGITHEILIGDVEIIPIFISFLPNIENIFEAMPASAFSPAPIIETHATFSSESVPSASKSLERLERISTTSSL